VTATLTSSLSSGAWSSSNTTVATIGSTGVVTPSAVGTTTILYTQAGCVSAPTVITVNLSPAAITGTTTVCGSLTTALADATSGGIWSSNNTALATVGSTGIVTGVGGGNPVISYSLANGCSAFANMTVNPLSAIGGTVSLCNGFSTTLTDATAGGVWSSSNVGVATIGSTGVVTSVSTGSTTINYTIASTGCVASVVFSVIPPPAVYTVTGGGSYCSGTASTVTIGLSGSDPRVIYQLLNGSTPVPGPGGLATGSGLTLSFGTVTGAGTYGVIAAYGSACATVQTGTATITVLPAPTPFVVSATGGGAYCAGTTPPHIFLSSSVIGTTYQLLNASSLPIGSTVSGTSGSIDFGPVSAAGVYSVMAANTASGCSGTMANTVTITVNSLPSIFSVTGGGSYCLGGTDTAHIRLNGSVAGTSYQLLLGGVPVGSAFSGAGLPLDFGIQPTAGVYTVLATVTATGCTASMTGSVTMVVNALPAVFNVTGGGSYCSLGVAPHVGLNGSALGVSYQLYYTPSGGATVALGSPSLGTGAAIDFGAESAAGAYTVTATTVATGCSINMFGSVPVVINPLPTNFTVSSSSAGYCAGGIGVHIFLSSSVSGISYTLINGSTPGSVLGGTGSALDFGLQTPTAPLSTYTVLATNLVTGCTSTTTSSVAISLYALPTTFTVTGGGAYCSGGTGKAVGLSGSTSGISYQLYVGGVSTGLPFIAAGAAFSFPTLQTTVGSYTVIATNNTTNCASNMTGSVPVTTTPLPIIYNVTGGGGYCAGTTTGVPVGLLGSDVGINYQLVKSPSTNVGAPIAGIGGAISFGTDTAGTYTVVAQNTATTCTSNMFGSAVIFINALPTAYNMSASGNYCAGGSGYTVSISNSDLGINYQLYNGGVAVGGPVAGTGTLLSFGNQTAAGNYTVVATIASTGCSKTMSGTTTIGINPLPTVYTVTSTGTSYCAGGPGVTVGLSASSTGISYQLYNGLATVGSTVSGTGAALTFGVQPAGVYTVVAQNNATFCTNVMSGTITVITNPLPTLYTISGGGNYCAGGTGVPVSLSGSTPGTNYQLWVGGFTTGVPLAGTGAALNFGLQTTAGSYTVVATNTTTGCVATMTGAAPVAINALPTAYTVNGSGSYCPGGPGLAVSLSGSGPSTVSYQLFDGSLTSGIAVPGTGASISFGFHTAGNYTVVATNAAGCTNTMSGSAVIAAYPLPTLYSVTGGGNYCPGTAGAMVGLSGSNTGINYYLYSGVTLVSGPIAGTGLPLNFGPQTAGTYTVVAMSTATSCSGNMSGSVVVGVNPVPTTHNITGGGNYCSGGTGLDISLDGSDMGNTYQLWNGLIAVGAPMAGTGFPIDFGLQTAAGAYTITATSSTTGCSNTMTGSVTIIVNTLPTAYSISGGGNYCAGTGGIAIGLMGSQAGVSYQLYNGVTAVGLPVPGTGSALSFGTPTAAGTYTIVGTNTGTGCSNTMIGSTVITVLPIPAPFTVTGGGNYCPGGSGVHVSLSGSAMGITYQLMNGPSMVGAPVPGTGFAIDFGLQTAPGTYSVAATNPTSGCTNLMTGTVTIAVNPAPSIYSVSSSSSEYCAGDPGVSLLLSGSDLGVNYQLYAAGVPQGSPVAGTGLELSFGMETAAGTYTVVATNATTGCMSNMASSATIVINPLPTPYSVVGGGNYCPGGSGVHIGLADSHAGTSYQLYIGSTPIGAPVFGTGFAIDFGLQTTAGTYSIIATNPVTTCVNTMAGTATIGINTLPAAYTVTGGGSYCASGDGISIGLSSSNTGVNYQLSSGGSFIGTTVAGTGSSISFGPQTTAGSYTVIATNTTTGCTNVMSSTASVTINSLPTAYSVSGGGNYCPGGSGVHVGVVTSAAGVTYQLYNGSLAVGLPVPGTGLAVDFGLQTTAGSYTVVATNSATGCTNNMSGSATIVVNTPPVTYSVIGGGNYCATGTGVSIGVNSSAAGVSYQLFDGTTPEGLALAGTGGPLDFGPQTALGTYNVVATTLATGCTANMAGSATVTVSPLVTPAVTLTSTSGDTICAGTPISINAIVANGGSTPTYSWSVNGIGVVDASGSFSYTPNPGDVVSISVTSSAQCATPAVVNFSMPLTVIPHGMPSVSISSNANPVCAGTSVTITPVTYFGGPAPLLSWIVNGHNLSSAAIYSYIPGNGDEVYATLTSDYHCRLSTNVNSNTVTMEVDAPVTPAVTVIANPGAYLAQGQVLLLTATITNTVASPTYQWLLNGEPIPGANASEYTTTFYSDRDTFSCVVVSGGGCGGMTGAGGVTIHVTTNTGVGQVTAANSDIKLVPNPNNGIFTVKGTLGVTTDEEVSIEVTDMLGQVIYKDKVMATGGNIDQKIQLTSGLANGIYLLNLRSESSNNVFHVVIEQ